MREFKPTDVLISFQSGQFSGLSHEWDNTNVLMPTSALCYIIEGKIELKFNNTVFDVKQGDLFLISAGTLHDRKVADQFEYTRLL